MLWEQHWYNLEAWEIPALLQQKHHLYIQQCQQTILFGICPQSLVLFVVLHVTLQPKAAYSRNRIHCSPYSCATVTIIGITMTELLELVSVSIVIVLQSVGVVISQRESHWLTPPNLSTHHISMNIFFPFLRI